MGGQARDVGAQHAFGVSNDQQHHAAVPAAFKRIGASARAAPLGVEVVGDCEDEKRGCTSAKAPT